MKLWVIRHAKSSWAEPMQADFDRPLNDRGRKAGKKLVRWMREQRDRPEQVVSSDAVRAKATTEFVAKGYRIPDERVRFDHRLYEAVPDTLLLVARELTETCASAALVGHNPGSTEFINEMVGETVIDNLPTFGIAILQVESASWRELKFGTAKLVALHAPKELLD